MNRINGMTMANPAIFL